MAREIQPSDRGTFLVINDRQIDISEYVALFGHPPAKIDVLPIVGRVAQIIPPNRAKGFGPRNEAATQFGDYVRSLAPCFLDRFGPRQSTPQAHTSQGVDVMRTATVG